MSGDEQAFAEIARLSADRLAAIAYRILRDVGRAEDAVQTTLVTAWRELPSLRDPARFDAWLHRILVNACYAEARKNQRWTVNVRLLPMESDTGADEFAQVVERDQLERGFRRLPLEQRIVVVFHYFEGLTLAEIADQLGLPIGTVKSRMHSAVAAMRAALDADARTTTSSGERTA